MHVAKDFEISGRTRARLPFYLCAALALMLGVAASHARAQLYGTGVDGAHTVVGTEVLTGNKNYTDLTVSAGAVLETHGFTIRVSGTLNNFGTVTDSWSGGTGGSGGNYGLGGSTGGGQPGVTGTPGNVGATGGGVGGDAGGGGGGGGGAVDSDDGQVAIGGRGGQGGDGGQGGGYVNMFCRTVNNAGVIQVDGFPGLSGQLGQTGTYQSYTEALFTNRDLAGGGGGGGGGGQGGNGGTIYIVYETLAAAGTITANGGPGGPGGPGGGGVNTNYSAGGSTSEFPGGLGGNFGANGGDGGRGEIDGAGSGVGETGQIGSPGSPGFITLTASTICYVDNDADGYGNAGDPGTEVAGSCGAGFSANNGDCDDGDNNIYPGATEIPADGIDQNCDGFDACYADNDVDGFGGTTVITGINLTCTGVGESTNNFDCDDADNSINPGASEIPGDAIDQNCDGFDACYADNDVDGYGGTTVITGINLTCTGVGESANNFDCDDSDNNIFPGATEIPDDGIDQNCDGADDITCYADLDGDGFGDSTNSAIYTGPCAVGYLVDNTDNCPLVYNPGQADTDGDNIGDACDAGCCLPPTVGDCDQSGVVDITDVSILIDNQFLTLTPLVCDQEGDCDLSGVIDITDISILIDNQFLTLAPLPACP